MISENERSDPMAAATNEAKSGEVDKIKDDIRKLRDDLGQLLGHIGSYGKGKVGGTREKVSGTVEDLQGRAYDRVQGVSREATERGRWVAATSRDKVQERPLTAVAVAFAAGLALASLLRWRR
jgi:ElaB/YqjD/DUF883 family membrane-anchored ribosome-binding protein